METPRALLYICGLFLGCSAISAEGDIAPPPVRTQRALVLLSSELPIKVCGISDKDKIEQRGRAITIAPIGADWLAKDPRVSIDIERCTATTTFKGGLLPVVHTVDLVRNGRITPEGNQVQLKLARVSVAGVPQFVGSVQAFTLGHASITGTLQERTNTIITCDLNFCDAQPGIPSSALGGCKFP